MKNNLVVNLKTIVITRDDDIIRAILHKLIMALLLIDNNEKVN